MRLIKWLLKSLRVRATPAPPRSIEKRLVELLNREPCSSEFAAIKLSADPYDVLATMRNLTVAGRIRVAKTQYARLVGGEVRPRDTHVIYELVE